MELSIENLKLNLDQECLNPNLNAFLDLNKITSEAFSILNKKVNVENSSRESILSNKSIKLDITEVIGHTGIIGNTGATVSGYTCSSGDASKNPTYKKDSHIGIPIKGIGKESEIVEGYIKVTSRVGRSKSGDFFFSY